MNRDRLALLVVGAVAAVAMVLTLCNVTSSALRVAFGLPLALFLPGYAFTVLLLKRELRAVERVLFSIGLSIALSIITGFVLNTLPWGIQPRTWALLLGGATLAAVGWALTRPQVSGLPTPPWRLGLSLGQGVLVVTSIIVVMVAVSVARLGAMERPTSGFTQLWLLPPDESQALMIRVGVRNMEGVNATYTLRLDGDGKRLQEWQSIELTSGQSWEMTVAVPRSNIDLVEASLFKQASPTTVYRHARLELHPPTGQEPVGSQQSTVGSNDKVTR